MTMKKFSGNVLFLDRSDINTDEIIPAKYLTEISKDVLGPHLLEDLNLEEFDPSMDLDHKSVIITRANFGCGSSREHAPWALETRGIDLVIAESFARIFRQNMYNCGMLAVELPTETIDSLFADFSGMDATLETNLPKRCFVIRAENREKVVPFHLGEFDHDLIQAGGWVSYADEKY
jgi:3-isopropylmalate/(R)-2-methylmalate dehydratase small subunit